MQPVIRKVGSAAVVEQAAIMGASNPQTASDPTIAEAIARAWTLLRPGAERGWTG